MTRSARRCDGAVRVSKAELRDDYFGHSRRVVWLAQHPTARLRAAADRVAGVLGLPLEEVVVGDVLLERAVQNLISG